MEAKARLIDASRGFNGFLRMTFEVQASPEYIDKLNGKELKLIAKQWRKPRSLEANNLMWSCIEKVATFDRMDAWEVYLDCIRKYGVRTYILVKPEMVDVVKENFRDCREVGELDVNGQKSIQLMCYIGSSKYDTKQFSNLLEGIFDEMASRDIITPPEEELQRALEEWENHRKKEDE